MDSNSFPTALLMAGEIALLLAMLPTLFGRKTPSGSEVFESLLTRVNHLRQGQFPLRHRRLSTVEARAKLLADARERLDKKSCFLRFQRPGRKSDGLTLIELIVIVAVMVVLIGVLLPALNKAKARSSRIGCVNCLKQVGLAGRIFATDNEGRFPWQVSTNAGGSREYLDAPNSAFRHFLAMSNELSTPKLLLCPKDKERTTANNWQIRNQNISYFVGLNASETNDSSFLSGDRNLMTDGVPGGGGLLELTTNLTVAWTAQMHINSGNVLFGDGHVDALSNNRLQEQLVNSGVATNRLLIP